MYSSAIILKLILCTQSLLRYGGRHTVSMMPGEGIGPEMMGYVKQVYKEAGVPVDFEMIELDPKGGTEDAADLYNVSLVCCRHFEQSTFECQCHRLDSTPIYSRSLERKKSSSILSLTNIFV